MNWLWIGDSHLEAMLPGVRDLSAAKGVGGAIYARSGWSVTRWLRDGDAAGLIASRRPDAIVVVLGTNDDPISAQSVGSLIEAARSAGAKVIWFGPFHNGAKDSALRAILGPAFVSGADLARDLAFRPDGNVHLTADGYHTLAPRLVDTAFDKLYRSSSVAPVLVIAGAALVAVALVAIGSSPVYEKRWKRGERNPFGLRRNG